MTTNLGVTLKQCIFNFYSGRVHQDLAPARSKAHTGQIICNESYTPNIDLLWSYRNLCPQGVVQHFGKLWELDENINNTLVSLN